LHITCQKYGASKQHSEFSLHLLFHLDDSIEITAPCGHIIIIIIIIPISKPMAHLAGPKGSHTDKENVSAPQKQNHLLLHFISNFIIIVSRYSIKRIHISSFINPKKKIISNANRLKIIKKYMFFQQPFQASSNVTIARGRYECVSVGKNEETLNCLSPSLFLSSQILLSNSRTQPFIFYVTQPIATCTRYDTTAYDDMNKMWRNIRRVGFITPTGFNRVPNDFPVDASFMLGKDILCVIKQIYPKWCPLYWKPLYGRCDQQPSSYRVLPVLEIINGVFVGSWFFGTTAQN